MILEQYERLEFNRNKQQMLRMNNELENSKKYYRNVKTISDNLLIRVFCVLFQIESQNILVEKLLIFKNLFVR